MTMTVERRQLERFIEATESAYAAALHDDAQRCGRITDMAAPAAKAESACAAEMKACIESHLNRLASRVLAAKVTVAIIPLERDEGV